MIHIIFWLSLFILSLFILIKASGYFTDSAEKLGIYLGMPIFLVGVTIVAIGTSLPELMSSIISVLNNSSEFVTGNVVGSNIANILLILGITTLLAKGLPTTYKLTNTDLSLLFGSVFIFGFTIYDGVFTLTESIVCLFGLFFYISYVVATQKKHKFKQKEIEEDLGIKIKKGRKNIFTIKDAGILLGGSIFIYIGARYTIDSVIHLSSLFNIGKDIIATSAVAIGTSLPELTVSINSARKGKSEIALGNILGSNIFNIFAVMGISGLFGTIFISENIIHFGLQSLIIATFLYFISTRSKRITLYEGWLFIFLYTIFIIKLFF